MTSTAWSDGTAAGMANEVVAGCVVTPHARWEMRRRGVPPEVLEAVLAGPEQRVAARRGREVYQSRISLGAPPRTYLVRVVVDLDRPVPEVVTVYRTSKMAKYWRPEG